MTTDKKRKRRWLYAVGAVIAAAALAVSTYCVVYIVNYVSGTRLNESLATSGGSVVSVIVEPAADVVSAEDPMPETDSPETGDDDDSEYFDPELPTMTIPVDFSELADVNEDIYAWLTVPGTKIDYPVLQHPTDDKYYLKHGSNGRSYGLGSIFSEHRFNTRSFEDPMDPVSVLYGHNMRKRAVMFTELNNFVDADYFENHPYFMIYTADRAYYYEIFAATSYSRARILSQYDLTDPDTFNDFFTGIAESDNLNKCVRESALPVYGDQVVILSTCYTPSSAKRFIVIGLLTQVYEYSEVVS